MKRKIEAIDAEEKKVRDAQEEALNLREQCKVKCEKIK